MLTATHRLKRLAILAAGLACAATAATAHPHVWVTARAQLVYADGRLVGVRDTWRFDPEYTSFITQGLDANKDGTLSPDELAGLAAENTANLAEFGYFTKLKVGGKEQAFADPKEPAARVEDRALVLTFLLPLKTPVQQGRGVAALEVYDPTYFVAFSFAEGSDAATLAGAPQGCAATVTRPKTEQPKTAEAGSSGMTEAFFEALTAASAYGVQFASRILVACP
ncbi:MULTISPECIES: DUF1007 family protein [Methylobacterium]|uniref:DUF1007 family protein n=1 Tax=Methylobacterium longum TaxID=767694 RepID=A0ABT8ALZ0_9HYPH|nr:MULTISPECIES: DUF1007 family protein [Methylobacterium]MCJ2098492.1 DUF1007 family protein [Methylobacterium sp. E-046]MDN3570298.1 DUF1007 family protein [Methylobacterium longum]GJE11295.1 hypothetical protein FOHLNKBM_2337 [Methylobacterium longum]